MSENSDLAIVNKIAKEVEQYLIENTFSKSLGREPTPTMMHHALKVMGIIAQGFKKQETP